MLTIQYKTPHLTVFESALFRTTSTLIETDDLLLLVDPNWLPIEIEYLQQAVQRKQGNKPLYLLFTHSDYDHIIGWNAFSDAKVIASSAFVNNSDAEKNLEQIRTFDDEYYISRDYEIAYPIVDFSIERDGQELVFGTTKLMFYQAKGHNSDGLFTIVNDKYWVAGDYLSDIEFPFIYHSSIEYEVTLAKTELILEKHQPEILIPGHGQVATSFAEILKRKEDSLRYIHTLRTAIKEGREFDLTSLWKRYRFPKIMTKFHEGNVALMKKELGMN